MLMIYLKPSQKMRNILGHPTSEAPKTKVTPRQRIQHELSQLNIPSVLPPDPSATALLQTEYGLNVEGEPSADLTLRQPNTRRPKESSPPGRN